MTTENDPKSDPVDSFQAMTPEWYVHTEEGSAERIDHAEEDLSTQELEQLYLQAMNAVDMADAVEAALGLEETEEVATADSVESPEAPAAPQRSGDDTGPAPLIAKMQPGQILEAALFVGGTTLTIKKLGRLLGESATPEMVEAEVQLLNDRYEQQRRPYQIRFGEGGYRIELKSDFERIRNRVYGLGPKDVKLSLEALEVLAMVAYRQPVTRDLLVEKGPKNCVSLLNQLLRRELIQLERTGETRTDVQYSTTDRFLQLFGLTDLKDLPQPDDLSFK